MEIILYILALMILYDFFLHLIEKIYGQKKAWKKSFYWPPAKIAGNKSQRFYDIFWTVYWGLAFVLIAFYLLI